MVYITPYIICARVCVCFFGGEIVKIKQPIRRPYNVIMILELGDVMIIRPETGFLCCKTSLPFNPRRDSGVILWRRRRRCSIDNHSTDSFIHIIRVSSIYIYTRTKHTHNIIINPYKVIKLPFNNNNIILYALYIILLCLLL